jgi:hypothetical protein
MNKKFPDDYTPEELASIEDAALESIADMGSPEFDRIVDSGDGRTMLMMGNRLTMLIDMPYAWAKPKFVLDVWDGKRWCYPTLGQAMQSYIKRKERQILLTSNTLRKAEAMLKVARRMSDKELKLPEHLQPQIEELPF